MMQMFATTCDSNATLLYVVPWETIGGSHEEDPK